MNIPGFEFKRTGIRIQKHRDSTSNAPGFEFKRTWIRIRTHRDSNSNAPGFEFERDSSSNAPGFEFGRACAGAAGGVRLWDLRSPGRDALALAADPRQGSLERMAVDPAGGNWLVTATSAGVFLLWDLRFQIRILQFEHPAGARCEALAAAPGGGAGRPRVWAASAADEIALWDASEARSPAQTLSLKPQNVNCVAPFAFDPACATPLTARPSARLTARPHNPLHNSLHNPPPWSDSMHGICVLGFVFWV